MPTQQSPTCIECNREVLRLCSACDYCGECCVCQYPPVEFVLRSKPHFWNATTFKRNPSKRYIAVEIEVGNASHGYEVNNAVDLWRASVVEDASLPRYGFEINTSPANGDTFIEQVEAFGRALVLQNAEVNDNCGLHVHVDARDFTYYDVRRMIALYYTVEPALFSMVSPSRRRSRYCRPCGEFYMRSVLATKMPKTSKQLLLTSLYGGDENRKAGNTQHVRAWRRPYREASKSKPAIVYRRQSLDGSKYDGSRYNALNVNSWIHRGTFELRLPSGTVQSTKIVGWGVLFARIVDSAHKWTEKQIEAISVENSSLTVLKMCVADLKYVQNFIEERIERFSQ